MTRPFDKHLDNDELDGLTSSHHASGRDSERLSEHELGEARRHVESCQDCSQKVQMHKSVQSEILRMGVGGNVPPSPDCVADIEWFNVAAGLVPEARSRELMKHAAQCGHCGLLLRNAAETFSDETTPNEEEVLVRLKSARPEWQRDIAETLRGSVQDRHLEKQTRPLWHGLFSWPRPAFALAALAAALSVGWLTSHLQRSPSAEQLLAQAYTDRRTIEARIPGAKYAPRREQQRSGASGSDVSEFDRPPALGDAEKLIRDGLRRNPNDPRWLQASGYADLLAGNYDAAIKTLLQAQTADPESPNVFRDLGTAYLVRAGSEKHVANDIPLAVENLTKALAKSPDDPITLFNRALALEGMSLNLQAEKDWQHYLRIDPAGEWSDQVRSRLAALQRKSDTRDRGVGEPLPTVSEISSVLSSNAGDVLHVDDRIERYLSVAVNSWLPDMFADDSSSASIGGDRVALDHLAKILNDHHDDAWLADFLKSPRSPDQIKALREFLASDKALNTGRYGRSGELARHAMRDFEHSGNQAGMLRGAFELMLSQALSLDYSDCIRTGSTVLSQLAQTRYRWLQSSALIEQGQCFGGAAQMHEAIVNNQMGLEVAKQRGFRELELRATAFGAAYLFDTDAGHGFGQLMEGLTTFWQSDVPNTLGENLYAVLSDFAESRDWYAIDEFALAETLVQFPNKDPLDRAIDLEFLGKAQERAGDYPAAQKSLQSASALLTTLPSDNAVAVRKAEVVVENAVIHLDLGDANGAIILLAPLRQQFEASNPGQFPAEYFKTLGEAYLALDRYADAQPLIEQALSVMESGLKSLPQEADRLSWSQSRGQVYRDLLEVKLRLNTPAEAFAWWEWYKGASLRARASTNRKMEDDFTSFASGIEAPRGTAIISYALLRHSIAAFIFSQGTLHVREIPHPNNLESLVPLFLGHCADSTTNAYVLNSEAARLYNLLLAPLQSDFARATALRFETDGVLDQIPFTLLRAPDNSYLGDQFEVTFSPGLAYTAGSRFNSASQVISADSRALILTASGVGKSRLAPLPEAEEEGAEVASQFERALVISSTEVSREEVLRGLKNAELFHFAGHAIADARRAGLVLGAGSLLSSHDLQASRLRNLRLAVLSACDTANGSEGTTADVNSIARTLVAAGVPQVVASRWKVDSSVTRRLMRAFYSNLISGKTPQDSLRAASLSIRRVPEYQHPYFWASFDVFGSS